MFAILLSDMKFLENKKAHFDYEILEKFEAGIELLGFEVKSIKDGRGKVDGSHITVRGGEVYLVGASISPYQPKNTPEDYNPERNRRLLLTKKEIMTLSEYEKQRGLTIVPLLVYNKGSKIKIGIAVARGKKKFDKRETLKKRDTERDIRRSLKK